MLFMLYIVCVCLNCLLIKSEDHDRISILLKPDQNCVITQPAYTFTEGKTVALDVKYDASIDFGWLRRLDSSAPQELLSNLTQSRKMIVDKSKEGIWEFEFWYLMDNHDYTPNIMLLKEYVGHNYTRSICRTNVTIVPDTIVVADQSSNKFIIIGSIAGVIAFIIIVAQAACIIYLRAKSTPRTNQNIEPDPRMMLAAVLNCPTNPKPKLIETLAPANEVDVVLMKKNKNTLAPPNELEMVFMKRNNGEKRPLSDIALPQRRPQRQVLRYSHPADSRNLHHDASDTLAPTNELEMVFMRRNNGPRPMAELNPKKRPMTELEQEEGIYSNERHSWGGDWTHEPIYNV